MVYHLLASSAWIDESHGQFYTQDKNGCKACHGTDLLGTPLAKVPTARAFRMENGTVTFAPGDVVRCTSCHSRPAL
jgi:hypothetical protein